MPKILAVLTIIAGAVLSGGLVEIPFPPPKSPKS